MSDQSGDQQNGYYRRYEIEGAKLTITDENGTIVETWTSGKEPHYIEKLPMVNTP